MRSRAVTLGDLARLRAQAGDIDAALKLHQKRLSIVEKLGDVRERAATLWDIAKIELKQQNYGAALPMVKEAYDAAVQTKSADGTAIVGATFGQLLAMMGEKDRALEVLRLSRQMFERLRQQSSVEHVAELISEVEAMK